MRFYTADTHFGHANIIKYCNRPFGSKQEMDEELINRWNDTVGPKDHVWHLGDFGMGSPSYLNWIFNRLNGTKHLVWGNHDKKPVLRLDWNDVLPYHELWVHSEGKKHHLTLCHFAMRVWNHSHHGSYQLYGHSHGGLAPEGLQLDVGVDNQDFRPVSFEEIQKQILARA